MKAHRIAQSFSLLATLALVFLGTAACDVTSGADVAARATRDLQVETPEAVGMSSDRLARLSEAMQGIVDDGKLAGIVTMVARRPGGHLVLDRPRRRSDLRRHDSATRTGSSRCSLTRPKADLPGDLGNLRTLVK